MISSQHGQATGTAMGLVAILLWGSLFAITRSIIEQIGMLWSMAAANLIAWLLSRFSLTTTEVVGRRELENVASPGAQWQQGAAFKTTLLVQVQAILDAYRDPDVVIAQLQARVREEVARGVRLLDHGELLRVECAQRRGRWGGIGVGAVGIHMQIELGEARADGMHREDVPAGSDLEFDAAVPGCHVVLDLRQQ